MSYKDILVFLDGSHDNEARLDFALSLSKEHGARLTGVDVNSAAAFESEWRERAQLLQEAFEEKARLADVSVRFKTTQNLPSWKNLYAHYSDLIIATQPNPEASGKILPAVPEDVLMSAGAPMIVLPHRWTWRPAEGNVVIAWSPSGQAARAVHDAMPILERAKTVTVFAFDPPADDKETDIQLLIEHLEAHRVSAESDRWSDAGDLSVIDALFASRAMEDADMIVAGAYSHSRLREALFGGTTKDLLQQISVPVLVSH